MIAVAICCIFLIIVVVTTIATFVAFNKPNGRVTMAPPAPKHVCQLGVGSAHDNVLACRNASNDKNCIWYTTIIGNGFLTSATTYHISNFDA